MTLTQQYATCHQIGLLLKSGMSLLDVCRHTQLNWLTDTVSKGQSIALAFEKRGFDAFTLNILKTGESTGKLDGAFIEISRHLNKRIQLRQKLKKAFTYPAIVMFVAILVSTGIFQWVVPQFALIFSTSNRELPWLTHQVILISEHFKIIMTTVGLTVMSTLITFMYFWKRFVSFQRRIDYLLMYLPIFGSIRQHALVTAWAKQLSQLLISQVPILDALSSLSLTASDWMIHDLCAHLHRHLEKGERIDLAIYRFKASKALFEKSDLHLIELATGTGQLPETLQIIANHHENKLNEVMDHLEQMIEPILMLIMGLLIGTIVVALYLPIFEMGHSL